MAQFDHGEEVGDSEEATKSLESFVSQYPDAQGLYEMQPIVSYWGYTKIVSPGNAVNCFYLDLACPTLHWLKGQFYVMDVLQGDQVQYSLVCLDGSV